MSSNSLKELNLDLYALKTLWRHLIDLFPQFDTCCVVYNCVSATDDRVVRMDWVIPEVTEEYWKKVMPTMALPANVEVEFIVKTRSARVLVRSPILREFTVKAWSTIIIEWWGG
jgi:hypothetical protein